MQKVPGLSLTGSTKEKKFKSEREEEEEKKEETKSKEVKKYTISDPSNTSYKKKMGIGKVTQLCLLSCVFLHLVYNLNGDIFPAIYYDVIQKVPVIGAHS